MVECSLRSHYFVRRCLNGVFVDSTTLENLQLDVWGDPSWLDGRYVCADYFGLGMLIGKVTRQSVKDMTPSISTLTLPRFLFTNHMSMSLD